MPEETRTADEQLDYALVEGVLRMHGALQQTIAATMGELQLTEPLADALWQLRPDDQPLSRRELAERLHCDPSNVTFLVDRLEDKGLVTRTADSRDRRVKAVSLTQAGQLVRQRLVAATIAAPIFAGLTKAQKQQLTQLLSVSLDDQDARAVC